jgi:hypothetical protein
MRTSVTAKSRHFLMPRNHNNAGQKLGPFQRIEMERFAGMLLLNASHILYARHARENEES